MTALGVATRSAPGVGRSARLSRWTGLPRSRVLAVLASAALLVAAWAALAPPVLGGETSYAVTDGVSMLPHFQAGDLVLLRKEPSYHVGEVAGYHNGQLGVVVMHRIVAVHNGRYVFKGDNNEFVDSYHPTKSQIVGAEWVQLSGWGNALLKLRQPGVAAFLLGLLWLFSFWRPARSRRRRRRHRHAS